jgi:hypothetical protein
MNADDKAKTLRWLAKETEFAEQLRSEPEEAQS